jgi:Rrf2 family protein
MISMAQIAQSQDRVTVISLAQKLDISKIFLEQVFSLLRRGGLVTSNKGAQGGYRLARAPEEISAYEILAATETALFEDPEETVRVSAPNIEGAMQDTLFRPANDAFCAAMKSVLLSTLLEEARRRSSGEAYMYYV